MVSLTVVPILATIIVPLLHWPLLVAFQLQSQLFSSAQPPASLLQASDECCLKKVPYPLEEELLSQLFRIRTELPPRVQRSTKLHTQECSLAGHGGSHVQNRGVVLGNLQGSGIFRCICLPFFLLILSYTILIM